MQRATLLDTQFGFTEKAQINWYARWRCHYAIPDSIAQTDYQGAINYKNSPCTVIDVAKAVDCSERKIDYIIESIPPEKTLMLPRQAILVFQNETYNIFKLK